MNIEAVNIQSASQFQLSRASDDVVQARKKKEDVSSVQQPEQKQVQTEELLQQIKALTEDGLYSVRFENDERAKQMVVKIVDRNDEVIRQVPAEEILQLKEALDDLRGNIVDTQS